MALVPVAFGGVRGGRLTLSRWRRRVSSPGGGCGVGGVVCSRVGDCGCGAARSARVLAVYAWCFSGGEVVSFGRWRRRRRHAAKLFWQASRRLFREHQRRVCSWCLPIASWASIAFVIVFPITKHHSRHGR